MPQSLSYTETQVDYPITTLRRGNSQLQQQLLVMALFFREFSSSGNFCHREKTKAQSHVLFFLHQQAMNKGTSLNLPQLPQRVTDFAQYQEVSLFSYIVSSVKLVINFSSKF